MQNFSDFIMKCAIFEEHSSSCVVYSRFSGTLFPVSMIDGESCIKNSDVEKLKENIFNSWTIIIPFRKKKKNLGSPN